MGELQAGSTRTGTLLAALGSFVQPAYLGREAEFFPAGKTALKVKVLPHCLRRGCAL
jgi:hypothetical protein